MQQRISHEAMAQLFVDICFGIPVLQQECPQECGITGHHEESGGGEVVFLEADYGIVEIEEPGQLPAAVLPGGEQVVLVDVAADDGRGKIGWIEGRGILKVGGDLLQPVRGYLLLAVALHAGLDAVGDKARPIVIEEGEVAGGESMELYEDLCQLDGET